MSNLSNGLAGLSLLTGSSDFASAVASAPALLTRAQRKAKAAFTTPETTAPWKGATATAATSAQVSAIKTLKTIIDKPAIGADVLPVDVQTSFTTYRALDRLRLLAEAASKDTTGSDERSQLQSAFAKGMADLDAYLTKAPSDIVDLAFGRASRQAQTVPIAAPSSLSVPTIAGKGVREARTGALEGVVGNEVLRIDLSQGSGVDDSVTVDLSDAPQPPTLDGVADAINAAIAAIPRRDAGGAVVNDADGKPVPRWQVKVEPTKTGDKWGLSIKRAGFETISIDQVDGKDALMVASGVSEGKAPADTRLLRFDDPTSALTKRTFGTISATDADATERSKMAAEADKTGKLKAKTVVAATDPKAMATDRAGFSYVVGTTAGDLGSNLSNGSDDLFLTKVDSEGTVVWRRNLGAAGSAQGAAVTVAPDGGIVIAGTVKGGFDGANSDGDMMVAKYDAQGNESFSTLIRAVGKESASAVAVGTDGSIFVGGTNNKGGAIVARLDATGKLSESRTIDTAGTDTIRALAVGSDGALTVLSGEGGNAVVRKLDGAALTTERGRIDLGRADARALAVAVDGSVVVAGAADTPLSGGQVNAIGARRDAFVTRIDAGLSSARTTYLGTGAEDQADSVSLMNGEIYVGGRTSGAFSAAKTGTTDGFVARVDASTGAIGDVRQFGTIGADTGAVQLSAVKGGNSVLGALGLHRGTLTPTDAVSLEAQTSLRAGDEFSLKVNGGAIRKITIGDNETLTTLADKIRTVAGTRVANITTPSKTGGRMLRIDMKPGNTLELVAGGTGRDALAKLGLDARRISAPATLDEDAPKVRPGGAFGLDLTDALQVGSKDDAKLALGRIKQAISFTQSAYRSLYWDDTKAAFADSGVKSSRKAGSTAVEQAQLKNYQAALTRLGGGFTGF